MWVAVGIVAAGAIGAAASTASAKKGSKAAIKQAEEAAAAQRYSADIQKQMYDQTRTDFQRFYAPSERALGTLESAIYGGEAGGMYKFQPEESAGFKYIKERTESDLDRKLRALGRSNSTFGANVYGRTMGALAAENEARQKDELWNIVKMGQAAAGQTGQAGITTAGRLGDVQTNLGNIAMQKGNIALQQGLTEANLYSGLGRTAADAYGMYQMGKYLNK